jgi:hypothetical protein
MVRSRHRPPYFQPSITVSCPFARGMYGKKGVRNRHENTFRNRGRLLSGQKKSSTVITRLASECVSCIPRYLNVIVSKALEEDRELRYQTMEEFATELKNLQHHLQTGTSISSAIGF